MSEAAAAFFANKKRKKKAFNFNANLIDVSAVGQTTHVEAPALSKDIEASGHQTSGSSAFGSNVGAQATASSASHNVVTDNEQDGPGVSEDDQQWDEAAVVSRVKTVPTSSAPEVLDMKSFSQSKGSDNISEKLRVEETKAQLAAAREGMEREAARAKAERERKEQEAKDKEAAKAATGGGGAGGIWVSARMRAAQSSLPKIRMGVGVKQQQLDMSSEELFPDLAAADKILEQKEKSAPTSRGPKKTPVGGGASWATKTNSTPSLKPPIKSTTHADRETEPVDDKAVVPDEPPNAKTPDATVLSETEASPEPEKEAPETQQSEPASSEPSESNTAAVALPVVKPKKTVKKKKKDTSTFKPAS
ncbi:hypothetical protein ACA910_002401 [Epithemia clementina (nom. ined.)]